MLPRTHLAIAVHAVSLLSMVVCPRVIIASCASVVVRCSEEELLEELEEQIESCQAKIDYNEQQIVAIAGPAGDADGDEGGIDAAGTGNDADGTQAWGLSSSLPCVLTGALRVLLTHCALWQPCVQTCRTSTTWTPCPKPSP